MSPAGTRKPSSRRWSTRSTAPCASRRTRATTCCPWGRRSTPFISQSFCLFAQNGSAQALDDLRGLIEAGRLTPVIDRTYHLADAHEAVPHFVRDRTRGKIAISV
ncbi:MAG TPA: zinc-binding dehydrogenase [Microbacterium sp.]|nr:zinc-binding dehydrogenase [Microbacterium sp.]